MPVKMTGACQSVKGCCNLFIEPQLTSFLVLDNLPRVFKIFILYDDISYQENSGSIARSLDVNTKNTTALKTTGSTIMVPDGLIIPKMYYTTLNCFCKKVINQ